MTEIKIYTDGAARGNPGPGGSACVLLFGDHRKELYEGYKLSTNNRMELNAAIMGLNAVKKHDVKVKLYSDSTYVVNSINKGWVFNWEKTNFHKKANADLWVKFLEAYRKLKNIEIIWVKGHSGNPENERCDELAVSMAKNPTLTDEGYKP